jgi:hypothetical protein
MAVKTLLDDRFAPTTSRIGFLRMPLEEATNCLRDWREGLYGKEVTVKELRDGFPDSLARLQPLIGGARPRELLIETSGGWTAYFDCRLRGTDATSAIGHLSRTANVQGLAVTASRENKMTGGGIQFALFSPLATDFMNYVRTIGLTFMKGRYEFETYGDELWFEEPAAYRSRKVRDRFTSDMLERYCHALDIEVFDPKAYGPRATLTTSPIPVPKGGFVMTFREVQAWLGIQPGTAGADSVSA